jgi:hypothetical protein
MDCIGRMVMRPSDREIASPRCVIRAFVKMREQVATNAAILKRLAEIDKSLLVHDSSLRDIYQKLLPLLSPRPIRPSGRSAFIPRASDFH